ncbi:MAG: hypothetical protein WBJ42_07540 [Thermovirgaceae bacterium]|nr:hypothetical protein [Synergistales bacterium]HPC75252.1 hypothetical protein [Synergistales bacterium]HRU90494.1 hypothetical protein [Thermovirgaceae bacterium]
MAGPDTWLGTARELWKDVVEGDRFPRWLRVLLALMLVGGILWSAFLFRQMVITAQARDVPPPPPGGAAVEKEITSLQETAAGFRNAVLARSGSTQLAVIAATLARRPFSPSEPETAGGVEGGPASASAPAPPEIWIKAILIREKDAAAVADIEGFGEGVILRRGTPFGGGLGKVLGISQEKVVVTWSGQQLDIPVDR